MATVENLFVALGERPNWKLARVQFCSARLAHGLAEERAFKNQALLRQSIEIGRSSIFASIHGQVVVSAVICHDYDHVGLS